MRKGHRMLASLPAVPLDGIRRYLYDIWQPSILLLLTAIFTIGFFTSKDPYPVADNVFFCNADGNVQNLGSTSLDYQPLWDTKLFFTVNMTAFKRLSFSAAKLIDACWDTLVGRGGQMLVAMLAYRVIRRSMTLTLESCDLAIPTVTSMYCQQIQITSVWQLMRNFPFIRSTASIDASAKRKLGSYGKLRLLMQIAVCIYVMAFATLVSVMTGYSAALTGVYGYTDGKSSHITPITKVSQAGMTLLDGSRIGLSDDFGCSNEQMPFPALVANAPNFTIGDALPLLRDLEEPYGVLIDCK